jgi:hypothetical protein
MKDYITRMKSSLYRAVAPKNEPPLVIAALHPKMLVVLQLEDPLRMVERLAASPERHGRVAVQPKQDSPRRHRRNGETFALLSPSV